jgi:hypothetical protein
VAAALAAALDKSSAQHRIRCTKITHNLKDRISTSLSFDPLSGLCVTCLYGRHAALVGHGGGPVVIAVSDQCFPACLPARTVKKECIRVIRGEHCSLQELTHVLVDAVGKSTLPDNTVIMLGSVSHMAQVGTEHYITDWVRSRWWIRDRLGENIIVLPLAPILVDGLQGRSIIRSMVEVLSWFIALSATEAVLMKSTLQTILDTQFSCTEGQGWQDDRQCFRLPAGLDTKATVAFVSDGWGSWPDSISPVQQVHFLYGSLFIRSFFIRSFFILSSIMKNV